MTTEPTEPIDPATRGTQVEVPAPPLGRCIDGISEYGFIVCTADENGNAVPVAPTGLPQEDDPGWDCATMGNLTCGTVAQDLPETGLTDISAPIFGLGVIFVSVGIFLIGVVRRS